MSKRKYAAFKISKVIFLFQLLLSNAVCSNFALGWNGYPSLAYKSKTNIKFELQMGGFVGKSRNEYSHVREYKKSQGEPIYDLQNSNSITYNGHIGIGIGKPIMRWEMLSVYSFIGCQSTYSWTESDQEERDDKSWSESRRLAGLIGIKPQLNLFEGKISLEYELGVKISYNITDQQSFLDTEATNRRTSQKAANWNAESFGEKISLDMGLAIFYWL